MTAPMIAPLNFQVLRAVPRVSPLAGRLAAFPFALGRQADHPGLHNDLTMSSGRPQFREAARGADRQSRTLDGETSALALGGHVAVRGDVENLGFCRITCPIPGF